MELNVLLSQHAAVFHYKCLIVLSRVSGNNSNRYLERKLYLLPTVGSYEDGNENDGCEIDEMGLTEDEVLFMVENETLELPRNFFRRLIKKSTKFTTLEYVGFRVRDLFPDNIIRLKDGRLKFVTHYETIKQRDPATGVTKSFHVIHGYCFDKVFVFVY